MTVQSPVVSCRSPQPLTDGCALARDTLTLTHRVTVDGKCPVLNTARALGLMVQGEILVLPPLSPGSSDGSGDLPARPDTAPLALTQPQALLKPLLNKPTSAMNRICPLVTRHRGKMLQLALGSGS